MAWNKIEESTNMKLADLKVTEFVDLLASDAPAPGGGSLLLWRALWVPL